jgi:hypothetical protein
MLDGIRVASGKGEEHPGRDHAGERRFHAGMLHRSVRLDNRPFLSATGPFLNRT